jgi:signal transduction histidine kinase
MSDPVDILIAEDSRTQAEVLRHLLEGFGFHVTHALDGAQALAEARRHRPALIISDVEMPVMDGYAMCLAIKQDPGLRDVPVILLTSLSDPVDVLRGLEARADYYLTKPCEREYLLSRVNAALAAPTGRSDDPTAPPLEVFFEGQRRTVTARPQQVLNLLLSTYGNAVQRNRELIKTQLALTTQARELRRRDDELREQNQRLEQAVRSEREAHEALKRAQSQMVQTEKLASLGQMVAGVAHEINNPLSFVTNNMAVLQRDLGAIHRLVSLYQEAEVADGQWPVKLDEIREYREQIDSDYTLSNLNDVLSRSREGLRRIQQIVSDLRGFARLDAGDLTEADLNGGLESTANILHNKAEAKQVRIELELGTLPLVTCYPAKINQVVLNLLANAIDASAPGGIVTARTAPGDGEVRIEISDAGTGIDPAIRDKIFDPFFTTKPPGQGTGLGLSISYTIVKEHGGSIEVESSPGHGACFRVHLPLRPPTT